MRIKTLKQESQAAEPKGLIRVIWIIRVRKNSSEPSDYVPNKFR